MPLDYRSYPEDDSPDLTDEEIETVIDTPNPHRFQEELTDALIHLSCGFCGGEPKKWTSALKRRKPHLYSRAEFQCQNGHVWIRTYRVDWLLRR